MSRRAIRPRPAWMWKLRVGDVLKTPSGLLRVVRGLSIHRGKPNCGAAPMRLMAYFTIRRCSWTRACYTLYSDADLLTMGWKHTGKRVRFLSKKARAMQRRIAADFGKFGDQRKLTCCSVEGIA